MRIWVRGFEPPTPCTPCKCATRLRYTQELLNGGQSFELKLALLKFFDTDTCTLFDDFFQGVPRMHLSCIDINSDRSGECCSIADTLHLEVGKNALFFLRNIFETDEIIMH